MNRNLIFSLILAFPALTACMDEPATRNEGARENTAADNNTVQDNNTAADNDNNNTAAANTAVNERDRDDQALTPMDQGQSEQDIQITAELRRTILSVDDLSTNADNVKIVTKDGVVTLRGPVATMQEKDLIEARARAVTGVVRVDNQLEVQSL